MQISRRDFIHAGCAVGAVSLAPHFLARAEAGLHLHGTGIATGQKAQANLNFFFPSIDFPLINVAKPFSPFGNNLPPASGVDPYSVINFDGYPSGFVSGVTAWNSNGAVYYTDAESQFTGSISGTALTVSGSVTGVPLFIGQTISGTGITAATRIVSGSGTSWVVSNSMLATGSITISGFVPWVLDWSGAANGLTCGISSTPGVHFPAAAVAVGTNRIEFNVSAAAGAGAVGAVFTANFATGNVVTVTAMTSGAIYSGMPISGIGIPPYSCLIFLGGSGGTGTYTIQQISGQQVNLSVAFSGVTVTGNRLSFGDSITAQIIINSIATTPSNVRLYRQDQEALLNGGQMCAPHFINFYKKYGRLRFMNWLSINGSTLTEWKNRPLTSNHSWAGPNILRDPGNTNNSYAGTLTQATGTNDFTGSAISGNPSVWTDGMLVQGRAFTNPAAANFLGTISGNTLTVTSLTNGTIAIGHQLNSAQANGGPATCTITAGSGTSWTINGGSQTISVAAAMCTVPQITAFTNANPAKATAQNHGLATNDVVYFPPFFIQGGSIDNHLNPDGLVTSIVPAHVGGIYTVTSVDANNFTLNGIDSTSWGTYSSGGLVLKQLRVAAGSLPLKPVVSNALSSPFYDAGFNQAPGTYIYQADLDRLIYRRGGSISGIPLEAACQIAREINGPDAWINIPHFATDDYVTQMATLIKANLTDISTVKWCMELSNEVWNNAAGFEQTRQSGQVAAVKWPAQVAGSLITGWDAWYGWRFYNMVQLVNAVFTAGNSTKVKRIFGFWSGSSGSTSVIQRAEGTGTGVAAHPLNSADSMCPSNYFGDDGSTFPADVDIYNYQQGVLTSNSALITSALNGVDAAFNSPQATYTAGISTTTMTVSAVASGTLQAHQPVNGSGVAARTYIIQQLTGPVGGTGTYQVSISQTVSVGTAMNAGNPGTIWAYLNVTEPAWLAWKATYSVPEFCGYEGGFGAIPNLEQVPTSYLGNPINAQDQFNLYVAYQASAQYAASYTAFLNAFYALGGRYPSQYCLTDFNPSFGGMYGMQYNIFGTATSAKTAFDTWNNG